jgi:putative endonuclease
MVGKGGYTYILTNKYKTVLYIGVTSDLNARIIQHKMGVGSKFTAKYNCNCLMYYEYHQHISAAIHREKRLKKWNRAWKEELITKFNPTWEDLYDKVADMR